MIIRSQDKKSITNFSQLTDISIHPIGTNDKYYSVVACYPFAIGDDYSNMSIGKYSTEEKAIKVLDMIQNAYERQILFSITYQEGMMTKLERDNGLDGARKLISPVFQMLLDEEVEV